MPVTPFHFGPGILLKAVAPRAVSLSAFVLSQIAIDIESGYHLLRGDWPVHRLAHTLPVAVCIGLLSGVAIHVLRRQGWGRDAARPAAEAALWTALLGGFLGGFTHPLLDAIMHPDVRPFWPVSAENPLLETIDLGMLHVLCVAAGLVGAAALLVRWVLREMAR